MANYPQIPGVDAMGRPLSQQAMADYAGVKLDTGGGVGGGGGGGGTGGGGGNLADQFKLDPVSVKYPAFMPGQMQALAGQLNAGFGGGVGNYTNYLNQVYEPFKFKQYQMPLDGVMGTGGNKKNPFDKKKQPNKWANWNLENQAPADPMQPYGQNWMW
jgi:hypothetical protein